MINSPAAPGPSYGSSSEPAGLSQDVGEASETLESVHREVGRRNV